MSPWDKTKDWGPQRGRLIDGWIPWIHSEKGDSLTHPEKFKKSEAMTCSFRHQFIPLESHWNIGSDEAMGLMVSWTQKARLWATQLLGEADRVLGSRARKTA